MTNSMTASGQARQATELGELSCEFRSVNHRYLEVAPRMPEELRPFETDLRELIGSKLARGRVDCFIRFAEVEAQALEPNKEVAEKLQGLLREVGASFPDMQPIRAIDVLRWPGMLQAKQMDSALLKRKFMETAEQALSVLTAARQREGEKMAELIVSRLGQMQEVLKQVDVLLPELKQEYRQRLEDKLAELEDKLEPARLEQEMVLFLQKSDVAEELDRLRVHMQEVESVLSNNEPTGRRLDFLMQELNREANTLGSKSQDARLTKASVDLKVLIEQMREQVQNIE